MVLRSTAGGGGWAWAVIPCTKGNREGGQGASAAAQKENIAEANAPAHEHVAVAAERREGGAAKRGGGSRRVSTLRKEGREAHTTQHTLMRKHTHNTH